MLKILIIDPETIKNPCGTCQCKNTPNCERDCEDLHRFDAQQSLVSQAKPLSWLDERLNNLIGNKPL